MLISGPDLGSCPASACCLPQVKFSWEEKVQVVNTIADNALAAFVMIQAGGYVMAAGAIMAVAPTVHTLPASPLIVCVCSPLTTCANTAVIGSMAQRLLVLRLMGLQLCPSQHILTSPSPLPCCRWP